MMVANTTTSSSTKVHDLDRASWLKMRYSDTILKAQQYMKQRANEKEREDAHTEMEAEVTKKQRTREKEREDSRIDLEAEVTKKQPSRKREREAARNESKAEVTKKQRGQVSDLDLASFLKTRYSDINLKDQQYKPDAELMKNQQTREKQREIGRRMKLEAEVMKKQQARKKEREAARAKLSKMTKTVDLEHNSLSVKALEKLAGCSLGFVIDRRKDGVASKVILEGFQGTRFWNPPEKVGLRPKD